MAALYLPIVGLDKFDACKFLKTRATYCFVSCRSPNNNFHYDIQANLTLYFVRGAR